MINRSKDDEILYYIGFGSDKLENLCLFFYCFFRKYKICVAQPGLPQEVDSIIRRISFLQKYKESNISIDDVVLGDLNGKFYDASKQAIELNERYWSQDKFIAKTISEYFNKKFSTTKVTNFYKKFTCDQIFDILMNFYQYLNSSKSNALFLTLDTKIVRFVHLNTSLVKEDEIVFARKSFGVMKIFRYYIAFLNDVFLSRKVVFNRKKKKFKIARETSMGFSRPTLRDDLVIDGKIFTKDDILFLLINQSDPYRKQAFLDAKNLGYQSEIVRKMPINFTFEFIKIFGFYFLKPLIVFGICLISKDSGLIYCTANFLRRAFFFEGLMMNYEICFYISNTEANDIESTVVFNKYGTKTVLYNWSDLTTTRSHAMAYATHNIYFAWGSLQYDIPYQLSGIDDVQLVGCTFKKSIEKESVNKQEVIKRLGFDSKQKVVVFCDNSFSSDCELTEKFYISYLELIVNFTKKHSDVLVFLKPKNFQLTSPRVTSSSLEKFSVFANELLGLNNFYEFNSRKDQIETCIAISDVLINMGMNTPALLALVANKAALYFDLTGNNDHPFAKYLQDKVVFSDKNMLIEKIDSILYKGENIFNEIPDDLLVGNDANRDMKAIERIKNYLNERLNNKNERAV